MLATVTCISPQPTWDVIRDFLAIHYRFNTRLDTPFWRQCRAETEVGDLADFLAFFAENGPSGMGRRLLPTGSELFGLQGYLALLIGMRVPFRGSGSASPAERRIFGRILRRTTAPAHSAVSPSRNASRRSGIRRGSGRDCPMVCPSGVDGQRDW